MTLSVAPMLDLTDRHFRYLLRLITRRTLLYSEMITAAAVVHGDRERLLGSDPVEAPVALQLAGDDPDLLAQAAVVGVEHGYAEINLNVGCPSDRVTSGNFGACLMKDPPRVAASVAAMRAAVSVPVTVKHRLGVDDLDSFEALLAFVDASAAAGADAFVVHARKAWLQGLSPKENRTVPPLRYDLVRRLKLERPELVIELNGGISSLSDAGSYLSPGDAALEPALDGVMLGRAVYDDPFVLAEADAFVLGERRPELLDRAVGVDTRRVVVLDYLPYIEERLMAGARLPGLSRHLLNLFRGHPGGRAWRRVLSERAHLPGAGVEVLEAALAAVQPSHGPAAVELRNGWSQPA